MNSKIRQAKKAAKSISHIVNGWLTAMNCLVDDFPCNEGLIRNYQNTINREFNNLLAGKPSLIEQNHAITRR